MSGIKKTIWTIFVAAATLAVLGSWYRIVGAQGVVIPTGSVVNVNAGSLSVGGDITNAGTLQTTSGTVSLTGNWANTGTYTPTTGTLNFIKSSGTQTLNSSGTAAGKLFNNLTHSGAGTLQLITNTVNIDGNFSNTAGTFNANSINMTVAGSWNNSTGATYTHGSATVTLDGTNQSMTGNTTFYHLTKSVAAAATLTFENTKEQIVAGTLTLNGALGQLLSLNSDDDDGSPTRSKLTLSAGGLQVFSYLNVKNNDAGNGVTLVGGLTSTNSGNNINWIFAGTTLTWQGDISSNWSVAGNWDLGFVPTSIDTAVIPDVATQPVLTAAVTIANLTVQSSADMNLAGFDLTISGTLSNTGTINLYGSETLSIATIDSDSGTFNFTGDSDGISETFTVKDFGATDYYNITFNDASGVKDTFQTGADLTVVNNTTVTAGTFNISTNANTLTTGATLTVSGGTFTATNGNIDANGAVLISSGTLTAPTTAKSFTVAGNFTHSSGTFTHSSGTVTLDGTSQTLAGDTTFYALSKITANGTLTFTVGNTQTIAAGGSLVMQGTSGNLMNINSTSSGTKGGLVLTATATQNVKYVTVRDNDATGGRTIVARNSVESPASSTTNWSFGAATMTWDGSASTDWDTADNWDLGIVPNADDTAVIADVANDPVLATNVQVENLTVNATAIVTLNAKNLTVDTTFINNGIIRAQGSETISLTQDTDSGAFQYVGDNDGVQDTFSGMLLTTYYDLTVNDTNGADIFRTSSSEVVSGALTLSAGTLDISTNTNTLTTTGAVTVSGGTLTATNGNVDANGSVTISSGVLTAPGAGKSFTIAGSFAHSGGTFTNSTGTVTLDSATTAVISGTTTFNNLSSSTAGKTIQVTGTTTQTISGTLTLAGTNASKIILSSTSGGSAFTFNVTGSAQNVLNVNVSDSNASGNDINCVNCTNSGGNDNLAASPHWIFVNVAITTPSTGGQTIDTLPTLIGTADAGATVVIKDISSNTIATTTADASGNWRVEATVAMATGANSLTPYLGASAGETISVTVSAAPSANDVPTITSPSASQRVSGSKPTIVGAGLANASVNVIAKDSSGNLLLSSVGTGTVNGSGNYSVTLTTALAHGVNYLSVTIDGVASNILTVSLTDPFGVAFDSVTGSLIENATVTMYRAATNVAAVPGVDLDAADINPVITAANGFYSFLAAPGNYYITVSAGGYTYPSVLTTFPSGKTVITGSKGETFTVGATIIEMDHPMDPTPQLLRITKDANKSEVRIGEVVTYTITIQNINATSTTGVFLEDRIPPGFKYLDNRVTLDGIPISNPSGNRPVSFNIGTIAAGQTRTLKYQLVVGSGVTVGNYDNTAIAKNSAAQVLSNSATETVKVVLDPLFDLGTVIGKVFFDLNENGRQDAPEYVQMDRELIKEEPVPNVSIVMEDGTVITADQNGQFSIPGIVPGRHLFRLDERTLPAGAYLTTEKVVIVDVTPGASFKVNFGVSTNNQFETEDQRFFTKNVNVSQDKNNPSPRMNVALWGSNIGVYNNIFVEKAEFRIFNNYTPFIDSWRLQILDSETQKAVKIFEGNRQNIFDPIFWDGKNSLGKYVDLDKTYSYVVSVENSLGKYDETNPKAINLQVLENEKQLNDYLDERKELNNDYQKWLIEQNQVNHLKIQDILVTGETLKVNGITSDVHTIRVLKDSKLIAEIPIVKNKAITAQDLLTGRLDTNVLEQTSVDVILPKGRYSVEIQDKSKESGGVLENVSGATRESQKNQAQSTGTFKTYRKDVSIGEDYVFFVGLGDAKVGYNFNEGNMEPVAQNDKYKQGFWSEGKLAYYLKGKILGKYLVTSSFDSEREKKELFQSLNPDAYYPIYGDSSTRNYQAGGTQGTLYLLVEWDRSSVVFGNYGVDFTDTEFAQFNRTLYGSKFDYKSVASTKDGQPKTRIAIFKAKAQQRSAHNEMLATGGSLYYLKHNKLIEGSDKVKIEVRDQITGLVISSRDMKEGADYEMDYEQGRMLFWKPILTIVDSYGIISNQLLEGNLVYVVTDYEYEVKDKVDESNVGARVKQAITDNISVGGTYVKEEQPTKNYLLKGTDVDVRLGSSAKVTAEYAESESEAAGSFVSTDGGLTYTELPTNDNAVGRAYGIKGDMRLFNRVGVESYYKWIDADFSTSSTTAQQGKEVFGVGFDYQVSDKITINARRDIQTLIDNGNLQTQAQVGAEQTTTSMVQVVHELRKLKLTGEYQHQEVSQKDQRFESATNQQSDIIAIRADYPLTEKTQVSLSQQKSLSGPPNDQTTIGFKTTPTEGVELEASETIGPGGLATTLGADIGLGKDGRNSLTISDTFTSDASGNTNQLGRAASVGLTSNLDDQTTVQSSYGVTEFFGGQATSTLSFGGTSQVDEKTSTSSSIAMSESSLGAKSTEFTFGTNKKLRDDLELATTRTFGTSLTDQSTASGYTLTREKDGKKLQGSLSRKYSEGIGSISRTNIFGLTGDIDDRFAFTGSLERGTVQNLDGSTTDRTAFSAGFGYVKKDPESAEQVLKSSNKLELRLDHGTQDTRQFLISTATEGKVTSELSLLNKMEYSKTMNTSTDSTEAEYREMMIGGAYRPIKFDRLNFLARYTYLKNLSPSGQTNFEGTQDQQANVFAFDAIYDINEKWQVSEKYAYRVLEEKVEGFDFNKTHTWLMIHRLNYNLDKDWLIGGEFRILGVQEAQDTKRGFLVEAARRMGQYAQLGVGYNFTDFSDDLTALNYKTQGPFIRMTGKFYDQTPEEIERGQAKWLEEKVTRWAWEIINDELSQSHSPVLQELNRYYALAQAAHSQGRLEESRQILKDIIVAGQMMFDEAMDYIMAQVSQEKDWKGQLKLSDQYYRGGEYEKSRKILEKILEDVHTRMLE